MMKTDWSNLNYWTNRESLHDDNAYIWDGGTVPTWRGQRCYSALLSHIIYQLHREGAPRIWIGASRQNQPSVRGFANAGFKPVVDLTYRRFYSLTLMWIQHVPSTRHPLLSAAYTSCSMIMNDVSGNWLLGYQR